MPAARSPRARALSPPASSGWCRARRCLPDGLRGQWTSLRLQFLKQPAPRIGKLALHAAQRRAERFGRFLVGEAGEKLHLDDGAPVRMDPVEFVEQSVNG